MNTGHPRLATWILIHCAPEYRRDSFIGDLVEQYETRGTWWYWRQVLGAARTSCVRRLLTANDSNLHAADYVGDLVTAVTLALFAFNQVPFLAEPFLRQISLFHSKSSSVVAETLMGVAFLGAVSVTHLIRTRAAAARQSDQRP